MLRITIPSQECWDEEKQEFVTFKQQTISLEHSLVSISKWESKWKKPFPFINGKEMNIKETIDYVRCMNMTQNVDPDIFNNLSNRNIKEIVDYISDAMTATTVSDDKPTGSREIITSELIYYWMISLQIPVEFQKWHLNRLLMLIRVCSIKNQPEQKMSQNEIYARNRALNEARRKAKSIKG